MNVKLIIVLLAMTSIAAAGYFGYHYWQGTLPRFSSASPAMTRIQTSLPTPEPVSPSNPVPYELETFAENLRVPWSMVFTSGERVLVTERPGRVRLIENGVLQPEPIRVFPEVSNQAEEGLMGLTLDPDYPNNKFIYLCLAYERGTARQNKVIRVTDAGSSLGQDTVILDNIPTAEFHAGCRVKFGPDGMLYITTGDARQPKLAQELSSLAGKILRINADGSIPADNPFANSPIYSYGHRNPQGLDWHPETGALIASEHGPSGLDGPGGGDEINLIKQKSNYGWPVVSHEKSQAGMDDPLLVFTPAIAPAASLFYRGSVFPQFTNHYFVGMLKGTGILHITFDAAGEKITDYETLSGIEVGRVRDIVEGPDGYIYFTTSNQDGRGRPLPGDDKIYRLVPR